jgi:acyl-CoA thioesterase
MTDPPWLGLEAHTPDSYSFELGASHARFDSQFYGGAGLAALTNTLARRSGRHPLWVTAQFVSSAQIGERVDCSVEVLAEGRSTTQARMTAMVGDRILLAGLGAAGAARPDGLVGNFGGMPEVTGPEDADAWGFVRPNRTEVEPFGPMLTAEFRRARGKRGITRLWVRMKGAAQTVESIAYLADVVPAGVVTAAGRAGAGSSLDNSIRFGPPPETDWVLLDVEPYFAHNGFVHGAARVWSPDGVLLAVASQTARALLFD